MPSVLRKTKDESNPKLPDCWGIQNTAGRLVYWFFTGGRTYFLILFCRGGKYGCDGLNFFRYKGAVVPEFEAGYEGDEDHRNWRIHRGTRTKQIVVKNFTADSTTDVLTSNAHGYANGTEIRIRSLGGVVPAGIVVSQKYFVINSATNTFQISETSGGTAVDLTSAGTGTLKVWKADAGFDDPEQGRPQFFTDLNLTFSNIFYIEGCLPEALSEDAEPSGFEFGLRTRRIADYDISGNYLGNSFSANNARVYADILINELKKPVSRLHLASWFAFKQDCDKMIWDRGVQDATAPGTGLTARYHTGIDFDVLYKTKLDAEINFEWADGAAVEGNYNDYHSIIWEGKIKPQYSEVYNFKLSHNDGAKLLVDNETIINQFVAIGAPGGTGDHTGSILLAADTLYNIRVEFRNWLGGSCKLYWSSASRSEQIIPSARLYPLDSQTVNAKAHVVFSSATQAGAALDEVMKRAPGWHVQDVNGKLKFLPPDRTVVHRFIYDPSAPDERFNIAAKTFEAKPRQSDERPDFRVHYYNDAEDELLAEKYIESNRDDLREKKDGLPSDVSPARWGVMTGSQTRRCAEVEMKIFSDPDREFNQRGQSDSYHVSVGDLVELAHVSTGETAAEPVEAVITAEGFGAGAADEKSYTLLPVQFPLVTVEPV